MSTIEDILAKLKSDKVKERQEGIAGIRTAFSRRDVVERFHIVDGRAKPKMWVVVFSALFVNVQQERLVSRKKSTKAATPNATALRRLSEAASVVRWLVEQTVKFMNKKLIEALIEHTTKVMVMNNRLFTPVALDYIKSLRCILNCSSHLEHLEDETWIELVQLGFNVVLHDDIKKSLKDEYSQEDNKMETDGDSEYEDDDPASSPGTLKRRRGTELPSTSTRQWLQPSKRKPSQFHTVSLEQTEFAALLSVLLRSRAAPFLRPKYSYLPSAVLARLHRFIEVYPTDSSLLNDYLVMLSSTLSHLSLNKKVEVQMFARSSWEGLLSLWGMKDRRLKEGLVAILRTLFPYVVPDRNDENSIIKVPFDYSDALSKLWNVLAGEADSRWGVDGISLDAIRLELIDFTAENQENQPFTAKTFRAGSNFEGVNALAWAIVQLQADCAAKLYEFLESIPSSMPVSKPGSSKRTKLENPIKSLLTSVAGASPSSRPYHLQVLLFLVDRHWPKFHGSLRVEIVNTLLRFVSMEDSTMQSWAFLTLAAIAFSEHLEPLEKSNASSEVEFVDPNIWASIWTHALRRVSIPNACRAACHAGHVLIVSLYNQRNPSIAVLSPQRFLLEIESLAKDIDVQGPSYPYESVCNFLSHCLTIASQDVRLYRMHFEDKVLAWLVDNWKGIEVSKDKLALNAIQDIILLLQTICGLRSKNTVKSGIIIPKSWISEQMTTETAAETIRDFLLGAHLPQFKQSIQQHGADAFPKTSDRVAGIETGLRPRGRERKVMAFFARTLDSISSEWNTGDNSNFHPRAETARATLDIAVIALIFQSLLIKNGTVPDRKVLQTAAKLISAIVPFLKGSRWSWTEKALVILGLEPILLVGVDHSNFRSWVTLLPPGKGSGIRSPTLERLLANDPSTSIPESEHLDIIKILWQNPDVRESFDATMASLREILHAALGEHTGIVMSDDAMDIDDQDGFAPIRTNISQEITNPRHDRGDDTHFLRYVAEVCTVFLTTGPLLQSTSGEPIRDKTLVELILRCADSQPKKFLLICPMLFKQVERKVLHLTNKTFDEFLDVFASFLQSYEYSKSDFLRHLIIQILDSTLDIWTSTLAGLEEVKTKVQALCVWLAKALRTQTIQSWETRDAFAQFLANYIQREPLQQTWAPTDEGSAEDDNVDDALPSALLPMMISDLDIRVRFRAAVLNAQLLEQADKLRSQPLQIYNAIKGHCTVETEDYEYMMTRLLSLGNIMIVDSGVRRGAYWHMLEVCYHTDIYVPHIEAVLTGVSQRLGLPKLSALCEAYSTHLAWSIRQVEIKEESDLSIKKTESSFFRLPPHLLGYKDRRQCAEATFRAFAPYYMLTNGQYLFERHCLFIQKPIDQGLRECFPDIVGFQIVKRFDDFGSEVGDLDSLLREVTFEGEEFENVFRENVEGVVTFMLSSLYETPSLDDDPVVSALRTGLWDKKAPEIFSSLIQYRDTEAYHLPNLPIIPAMSVLDGIAWLKERLPGSVTASTTYHVLHELLSRIHRSPFVNEQLRLVKALSLWVSIQAVDFQDGTLLYTLTHGATTLLTQPDLARSAQSILEWTFSCYKKYGIKDTRLSSILLRIACTAHDYSLSTSSIAIVELGISLIRWTDIQVINLTKTSKSLILRALAAWPHELSPSLLELCHDITSDSLSTLLGDPRVSSDKFRLVRRLREHKLINDYDSEQFSKFDFWRIKESIPSEDRMQENDVEAFLSLLELHHGKFSGFSIDQRASESIRDMHRLAARKRVASPSSLMADETPLARDCVVVALLKMLQRDVESQVYIAYKTLRLIMAVMPESSPNLRITEDQRKELEYLQLYRRFPREKIQRDLVQELETGIYLESITDFSRWIALVTTLLSDCLSAVDPVFGQLHEILGSDVMFAEDILPVLVHTLLLQDSSGISRKSLSQYFKSILLSKQCNVRCLRSVIDTILHLRYFAPGDGSALAYNYWLDMDFTLLAQKAIICGAYTTALLFLELAAEQKPMTDDASCEQVLYEIYAHIDEPDGFYGIHTNDLQQFLIKRFHHEQQWEKAFRFHGAALEAGKPSANQADGLMRSFHSFGFDRLAIDTLQNSYGKSGDSDLPSSMSYRLGWRTETWDLPAHVQYEPGASLYQCLRAVYRERDQTAVDSAVRQALSLEMFRLRNLGPENVIEIRQATQDLMSIHQVSQWRLPATQQKLEKHVSLDEWDEFVNIDFSFDFSDLENIMATRISLIRSVRQREERQQIGNLVSPFARNLIEIEKRSLLRLSEAARKANQVQIALNAVVRAQGLEKDPSFDVSHEFAHVLWLQREEKLSVQFLQKLLRQVDDKAESEISTKRKALLLSRLGSWTSEACLEKPTDIWDRYFSRAISILESSFENSADHQVHASVYHECAIFANRQYHAILKSPDALRWKVYVDRKTQEIARRNKEIDQVRRSQLNPSRQSVLEHEQRKAQKVLEEDSEMYSKHTIARDTFLKQAIEMYSRCLQASDIFDNDAAIRLCSLWFSNFEDEQVLKDVIPSALERIPSAKMVFLAHQLTARLAKPSTSVMSGNQENLQKLLLRMCTEHPFHSLYQVYCLRPAGASGRRQSGRQSTLIQTERGEAAANIFERLRADAESAQRVRDIELLCDACLQWAKFPIKGDKAYRKRKTTGFKIPDNMAIRRISNLRIPVSTCHTPVDRTMRYDDCVWINTYDSTFDTAGGVNIPKITVCLGSDGKKYKQLFKGEGNDDLRQDAVMEQVFQLVNTVLQQDRETQRRKLSIREYKVIPLDSQAGLLEFVGNTIPLRSWLDKAHNRYRPSDLTPGTCMTKLSECARLGSEQQIKVFQEIQKKFKPVMRHYFTEKHKGPISWFSMRLNYIRSVATTSIVGHVLGLGDRHTSNILLDNASGEVIHIDLGIAFDQGKLLPVPERVPFRMTADMVDGMGISGTQGVFQRCAEETLRVLRKDSEVIMTVLEVFKHDPLHSWVASDVKVKHAQKDVTTNIDTYLVPLGIGIDMSSGSAEEAADRALSSVSRKLDKSLSVETTVNELIAEATDIHNLATIYYGWGSYY